MKYLVTIAIAAACGLASLPSGIADDVRIQAASRGLRTGNSNTFSNYGSDSYGRRLNRYQSNYGYNNNGYRNNGYGRFGNSGQNGYRNYDYYGGNYGRVRDYRNQYRSNQYRGFNNGYYNRPGFSIGGGSSRIFFGF